MSNDEITQPADADLLAQVRDAVSGHQGATKADDAETTVAASEDVAEIVAKAKEAAGAATDFPVVDSEATIPPPSALEDAKPSKLEELEGLQRSSERPDRPSSDYFPDTERPKITVAEADYGYEWRPPKRMSPAFQPAEKVPIQPDIGRLVIAGIATASVGALAVLLWWYQQESAEKVIIEPVVEVDESLGQGGR